MDLSLHRHTPTLTVIDPRGLSVRAVSWYRAAPQESSQARVTQQSYDPAGRLIRQRDPRLFAAWQQDETVKPNHSTVYSLSGQALHTDNVDAGWRTQFNGDAGQLLSAWDGRGSHHRVEYDALLRPAAYFERAKGADERCRERLLYACTAQEDVSHNRCGQLIRQDDSAGSQFTPSFSLLGQVQQQTRQFLAQLTAPDWPDAVLEENSYSTAWQYDALGNPLHQIDAVGNLQSWRRNVAGQLVESSITRPGQLPQILLRDSVYGAFGQVLEETAGNGVISRNLYQSATGLLTQLSACKADGTRVQDLRYRYDPVGNVLQIDDYAQPTRFFRNQVIEPISTYEYDTLYQLISATGREVDTATRGPGLPAIADANQLVNYRQTYQYDRAGNMQRLSHQGAQSWNLRMATALRSNRSLPERNGELPGEAEIATAFDRGGNLQALQPGQGLVWDLRNQLQKVSPVVRVDGSDDCEHYLYDAGGQRVRKITLRKAANVEHVADVRYLPGLEIRHNSAVAGGEVLHVISAGAGRNGVRLLHWEQGQPTGIAPDQLRYSLSDHLGSSTLELDDQAATLSQEGYYPFGGTAWWAARNQLEASYKTIRYSGEERDATGLYYYGLRYYAPWLCRWINPDPAGDIDGLNRYWFVRNSPVGAYDVAGLMFKSAKKDKYEELAVSKYGAKVTSRGLKKLRKKNPDLANKIVKAFGLAQVAVKEARSVVDTYIGGPSSTHENDTALKSILTGRNGLSDPSTMTELARVYKGVDEELTRIASDPEMNSLVFLKPLPNSTVKLPGNAFVMPSDPEHRVFFFVNQVEKFHVMNDAKTLLHELSHFHGTRDVLYIGSTLDDLNDKSSVSDVMSSLQAIPSANSGVANGMYDQRVHENLVKVRDAPHSVTFKTEHPELMGDLRSLSNPGVREKALLINADSVAFLAMSFATRKLQRAYP